MAASTDFFARREAGQDWLLTCTPTPADAARAWDAEILAPIRGGTRWRAVEAPLMPSVDAMKRVGVKGLGPVLADVSAYRAWWLVSPDVGDLLDDIHQLQVMAADWPLRCPPVLYPVGERVWLERPDGSGRLTDPISLGAAFRPGGLRLPAEAFG